MTVLFKAFGYSTEDLLSYFYKTEKIIFEDGEYFRGFAPDLLKGTRATKDVADPESGDVIVKKGRMFTQRALKQMTAGNFTRVPIEREDLLDKVIAFSVARTAGWVIAVCFRLFSASASAASSDLSR